MVVSQVVNMLVICMVLAATYVCICKNIQNTQLCNIHDTYFTLLNYTYIEWFTLYVIYTYVRMYISHLVKLRIAVIM